MQQKEDKASREEKKQRWKSAAAKTKPKSNMHQKEEKKLQEKEDCKDDPKSNYQWKNLAGEEEEDCNFQKNSNQEKKNTIAQKPCYESK